MTTKNYIQKGEQLTVAAPYNVNSGQGVLVGQLFGIAMGDALSAASVDIRTEGVVAIAKDAESVFAVGTIAYFDTTTLNVRSHGDDDSNSAGETEAAVGVVTKAAGAGATSVEIKLSPSPVTLV